jgi:hypothetical protein
MRKKFEMMLIDYPHSKNTNNLKFVEFENFENLKSIEHNFKISKVLYHMSMWCNVHDI